MARKFAARNFQSAFCQYPAKLKNKSGLMGTSSAFALQVPEQVLGDRAIARSTLSSASQVGHTEDDLCAPSSSPMSRSCHAAPVKGRKF
jgi:hypothetical protein